MGRFNKEEFQRDHEKLHRKNVINDIKNRSNMLLNDTYTYLWCKTDVNEQFKKAIEEERLSIGGGNFSSMLALMSVLNFLGKIYKLIREPDYFRKCDISYRKYLQVIESNKCLKEFIKKWNKEGVLIENKFRFNEQDCYKKLLKDCPKKWEYNDSLITQAYKSYRNSLVHMSMPRYPVFSIGLRHTHTNFNKTKSFFNSKDDVPPFSGEINGLTVVPEHLQRFTCRVLDWITIILNDDKKTSIYTITIIGIFLLKTENPEENYKNSKMLENSGCYGGPNYPFDLSRNNRQEIMAGTKCGCFHCANILEKNKLKEWIDKSQTAICPKCGYDTVIPNSEGYNITKVLLRKMRDFWF